MSTYKTPTFTVRLLPIGGDTEKKAKSEYPRLFDNEVCPSSCFDLELEEDSELSAEEFWDAQTNDPRGRTSILQDIEDTMSCYQEAYTAKREEDPNAIIPVLRVCQVDDY